MKILIIHQNYLMEGQGGGSRFNQMARVWAQAGHQVTVIAGTVDYSTGQTPERYRGRWISPERDGDVRVWRCHVPPAYLRSYAGRMWAFLGFMLSAATACWRERNADVVIATSPPLVVAPVGWMAARLRRRPAPWIFEIRDLWPESAITTGVLAPRSLLARGLYRLERWACRRATHIAVLTPAFRADLVRRGLAGEARITIIPNGADLEEFRPGPRANAVRRRLGWGGRFVALYSGAHGRANALDQLVEAAALLAPRRDILIACVGDGPERPRLEAEARRRGLDNIRFYGPQPKAAMPEFIHAADAGLAVLQHNPTFATVYPNKIFDYMACGRPIVLAISGVARELVCDQANAGIYVEPENGAELAQALCRLAHAPGLGCAMGARGRSWVEAHASRAALAGNYLALLEQLAASRCGPQAALARAIKRAADLMVAATALVLLAPSIGFTALLVRVGLGRPVFFRQPRLGLSEREFDVLKFRTMREASDAHGHPLPDAERLTRLGKWLRRTSLDELPQLWNVLRGEMSLVGPRPLFVRYRDRYSPEHRRRHQVRPGITGWAQVHGRNQIDWEERFTLDIWYVDHWSLRLDLKILLLTAWKVLRGDGISRSAHATMPEFAGSAQSLPSGGACKTS